MVVCARESRHTGDMQRSAALDSLRAQSWRCVRPTPPRRLLCRAERIKLTLRKPLGLTLVEKEGKKGVKVETIKAGGCPITDPGRVQKPRCKPFLPCCRWQRGEERTDTARGRIGEVNRLLGGRVWLRVSA